MNRARSKTLLLDAKKQTCMDTLGRKIGNDEEEEKERRARSLAMPARQSAKSPRMGKLKSHVRCEWSRSMRTTRSSTNLCCRRRDRIFSRAFLAPAFTSCFHEIGCLPTTVVESNLSLDLHIRRLPTTLHKLHNSYVNNTYTSTVRRCRR